MTKQIIKYIEGKLKLGVSKEDIEKELKSKYQLDEYKKILSNYPDQDKKSKYKFLNNSIIIIILLLILLKIPLIIYLFNSANFILTFVITAIGLFIPFYIIRELLWYKHTGYFYVIIVSGLGLQQLLFNDLDNGLNFVFLQFIIILYLIISSVYLNKKLYNKFI